MLVIAGALALGLTAPTAAGALVDAGGAPVPNTSTAAPDAQLVAPRVIGTKLAAPFSPGDDSPVALAALGAPQDPEGDLGAALDGLAAATDSAAARTAAARAIDILEGNPIPDRVYSGMPLLNWNAPAKVKTVPAGGNVDVRQVRFGDHTLTDTWALRFADPQRPFTITYRVAELGPHAGGRLAPAPLLADGATPIGGLNSVVQPLGLDPMLTGTQTASRFHPAGAPEATRQAVQEVKVAMPPARLVRAILDPSPDPGDGAPTVLHPTSPDADSAAAAFGFSGSAPTSAERTAAIEKLGDRAPEKQIWRDLRALPDPADPAFLDAARATGSGDRQLVGAMRTRTALPAGVVSDPAADVNIALLNDEVYVSTKDLRVRPGAAVTVAVTNADGFEHSLEALDLGGRRPVFGALDWGEFDWRPLDLGAPAALAPGERHTFTLQPRTDSFALALSDPNHGDQATAVVSLDRGPRMQSLPFGPSFAAPLHSAEDAAGNVWLTLSGVDKIAKLSPAGDLTASAREEYSLPGGSPSLTGEDPALGPHDIAIDAHGIVWTTLTFGNAVARIDPAKAVPGTSEGITIYPLEACTDKICKPRFPPPVTPQPLTRSPLQMKVTDDGWGDTVVWFTEESAGRIGSLRVAADGTKLGQVDFGCGCDTPLGLGLGPDGDVWFTEIKENRIGRLRLDQTRPWAASAVRLDHYPIATAVNVENPALGPDPIMTSSPHSLTVDRRGLVWFTEEAVPKLGVLDPTQAKPGTSQGIRELDLGKDDFGREAHPADLAVDRAGTAFWVDEYGDMVGSVTLDGERHSWRPPTRQSLTDAPMLDDAGNFWFVEGGSNQLTRISALSEGLPRPGALPVLTASTSDGSLTAEGLREIDSVDVEIVRGGAVVARAGSVPVAAGGSFRISTALSGGDTVRVIPHGRFARAPMVFTVAALDASAGADGTVTGHALGGGSALAGHVVVEAGVGHGDAAIADSDGTFATQLPGAASGGVVWWSGATSGAIFRTQTAFSGPGALSKPASTPVRSVVAPQPADGHRIPTKPAAAPCRAPWLVHVKGHPQVVLLGLRRGDLAACFGPPARAGHGLLRFGSGLFVRLARGVAQSIELRDASIRSVGRRVGVGSSAAALRRELGTLRAARFGVLRAVIPHGRGRAADVRVYMNNGRAVRIRAALVRVTTLDDSGRKLLGALP